MDRTLTLRVQHPEEGMLTIIIGKEGTMIVPDCGSLERVRLFGFGGQEHDFDVGTHYTCLVSVGDVDVWSIWSDLSSVRGTVEIEDIKQGGQCYLVGELVSIERGESA